jgi:hypothetical protein
MGYNIEADPDEQVTAAPANALGENVAPSRIRRGLELKSKYRIRSSAQITSCSTCHR